MKILNAVLIVFTVFMAIKHGWGAVSAKPETLAMFAKWDIGKTGVQIFGSIILLSGILVIFPQTFFWGNLLTATCVLFMALMFLRHHDLKGALIEIPFLLLPCIIQYLDHPLQQTTK